MSLFFFPALLSTESAFKTEATSLLNFAFFRFFLRFSLLIYCASCINHLDLLTSSFVSPVFVTQRLLVPDPLKVGDFNYNLINSGSYGHDLLLALSEMDYKMCIGLIQHFFTTWTSLIGFLYYLRFQCCCWLFKKGWWFDDWLCWAGNHWSLHGFEENVLLPSNTFLHIWEIFL